MVYNKSVNEIVDEAHDMARSKGFYEDIEAMTGLLTAQGQQQMREAAKRDFVLGQLAKIGSEVGETVQAIQRKGIYHSDVAEELADVIIRVCDLAGFLEINLGREVHQKMRINAQRPRKHGKLC